MMKLNRQEFDAIVARAIRRLPEEIRTRLDEVPISVRDRPTRQMCEDVGVPEDEPLLGLYVGTPLPDRSVTQSAREPDTILLFREPLEEMCETRDELEEEIEITLAHEIAHYVGLDDDRLAELGYD
jgi:predicted Zn-dependent protease with MMP-like domain